jgi:polyisoprenoid-binding protein YceI
MTTAAAATLAAGQWKVDVEHSTATFTVGNLGHTVTGTVPILTGTVEVGPDGLPSAIYGTLDLSAVATGISRRDKDLRKPRLLDLDRYPVSTFEADRMTASPGGWSVSGYLTARGTRTRLTGDVEVSAQGQQAQGQQAQGQSAILTARTQLDRRALGLRAPKLMIGHQVDITVTATIHPASSASAGGPDAQ